MDRHRLLCPEISLEALTVGSGEGLFKLARHFLLDAEALSRDFDASRTGLSWLRNLGLEKAAGFVMEEDFPRSRGDRAIRRSTFFGATSFSASLQAPRFAFW